MKNGDSEARTTLIEHNLRLVSHIIKKYYANYDELEDLVSISTTGLLRLSTALIAIRALDLRPMLLVAWKMLYYH